MAQWAAAKDVPEVAALLAQEADHAKLSRQEALESTNRSLSYYEDDLVVIDWDAGRVSPDDAVEFGRLVAAASRPIDDHRATADYRRHLAGVLAARAVR